MSGTLAQSRWHWNPARANGVADDLVGLLTVASLGDGWNERIFVECRAHPFDDVVVERLVGVEVVADRTRPRLGHRLLARLRPGVDDGWLHDAFGDRGSAR